MEDKECLVELDEVLAYLSKEDLEKIPSDIRESIKAEKDKQYIWKYDESKPLTEQKLNRKTIAMLSYLNIEYLLNDEQKAYMEQLHLSNERKKEDIKRINYNPDNIFAEKKKENSNDKEVVELSKVNENKWYEKIIKYITYLLR